MVIKIRCFAPQHAPGFVFIHEVQELFLKFNSLLMKFKNVNTSNFDYLIGLDLGVTSLGWSVVEISIENGTYHPVRLIDAGVRVWDKVDDNSGNLPSVKRREARSARRRLRRRRSRLSQIKNLFIQNFKEHFSKETFLQHDYLLIDPYFARAKGLDERLSVFELSRAILHLAKRRGFQSNIKEENAGGNPKDSEYQKAIAEISQKVSDRGYRTLGEMLYKDPEFNKRKRNSEDLSISLASREQILEELKVILEKQVQFGLISQDLSYEIFEIVKFQRPFASSDNIINLVGRCSIYKDEPRAPKFSLIVEEKNIFEKLNNVKLVSRELKLGYDKLTKAQKFKVFEYAKTKLSVSYWDLRCVLDIPSNFLFKGLDYHTKKKIKNTSKELQDQSTEETAKFEDMEGEVLQKHLKKVESIQFISLKGHYYIQDIINMMLDKQGKIDQDKLEGIIYVMNYSYTDQQLFDELAKRDLLGYYDLAVKIYRKFSGTSNLSVKACRDLLPFIRDDELYYSEAVSNILANHSQSFTKLSHLPEVEYDDVRNPIVHRAISQTRKVVNALIDRYGAPSLVHIELSREMKLPRSQAKRLQLKMHENAKTNEQISQEIKSLGLSPSGFAITKYKLWKEQDHKCAYSGREISVHDLMTNTDIDHILPYSRSLDDSMNNKVLVFASENRDKRDKTPYEYFGHDTVRWERMLNIWQNVMKLNKSKLTRLVSQNFTRRELDEFLDRDLNDNKYISRFVKNFIELNLMFKPSQEIKRRVYTFQGMLTSLLRRNYGLSKERSDSLRHHALDAVIVGIASQSMLMKFTEWYKKRENYEKLIKNQLDENSIKLAPEPWINFRDDVLIRVFSDDPKKDLQEKGLLDQYADRQVYIRPIFVSHKSKRKLTGPIHDETIKSIRNINGNNVFVKTISIHSLKKEYFDESRIVADENTIEVLRKRLEENSWDTKKAFAEPVYKPSKNPDRQHEIKKVKIIDGPANTYVTVHGGKGFADNGRMIRVDVFKKDNKYYSVPVYASWLGKEELPTQYTPLKDNKHIDDTFEFEFSLYPGDLVSITEGSDTIYAYYVQMDSSTPGNYVFKKHDKDGYDDQIRKGIKTVDEFRKKYVDELGFIHDIQKELRKPLMVNM